MDMKRTFPIVLLCVLGACACTGFGHAHGAFYPHHLQDFGMIRSREEVRITVLVVTGVFVLLLSGVIVLAIKKGQLEATGLQHDHGKRLRAGIDAATIAASTHWPGDSAQALAAALEAYAAATGNRWNPALLPAAQMPVRCQFGGDLLVLHSHKSATSERMMFQATHQEITIRAFLEEKGEIHYERES